MKRVVNLADEGMMMGLGKRGSIGNEGLFFLIKLNFL